jgi:hypothetical protein
MPRRASRRTSLCTRNRSFFFLAISDATKLSQIIPGLRFVPCDWSNGSEPEPRGLASKAKECKACGP